MEKEGHAIIPSSALIPENDPSTLFTGSGMQPLVPYLMGEKHPKGTRLTDSQKCFRAEDIEEVGDNRHTTFFEMLGNWSLGDYFKKEQLPWFFTFLVDEIKLDPNRLYVTVFAGDANTNVPKDEESAKIWKALFKETGINAVTAEIGSEKDGYERGMKEGEHIFYYDASKNWWSRAGKPENMPTGEIGGPDSEVFYDFDTPHDEKFGKYCHPNCDCGRFLEIGNSVFMEYVKKADGSFEKLPQSNVDFGGGLERIVAAQNESADIFTIDLLHNVIKQLETLSGKAYDSNLVPFRVIADHIRGAVFIIADGVEPSNTEQGYFVRRLLRRAVRYADILGVPAGELKNLAQSVIDTYKDHYNNLDEKHDVVVHAIELEEIQFRKTLEKGLKELHKLLLGKVPNPLMLDEIQTPLKPSDLTGRNSMEIKGSELFTIFTTYGFPLELSLEELSEKYNEIYNRPPKKHYDIKETPLGKKLIEEFEVEMKKHQETSRTGAEHKFKGGLADNSEKVVSYHTATHLLLAGLRKELGEGVAITL